MSGAIAIFVKTPGFSPIKTRLAATLGEKNAEAFHRLAAQSIEEVVMHAESFDATRSYYAVAEQAALDHPAWRNLPCIWQGDGGLGERMGRVYRHLLELHDFVILTGADIPQMTAAEILAASAWLSHDEQARMAFGPSVDGGFWLFGGNCFVPQHIWTDVVYSVADTGIQFFNKITPLGEIRTLRTLNDVDTAEDLEALHQSLLDLSKLTPGQQELMGFLTALLS